MNTTEADFEILALVDTPSAELVREAIGSLPGCSLRFGERGGGLEGQLSEKKIDLILLDPEAVSLNAAEGISLLKAFCPCCEIVLLLSDQDITVDVELMKIGAYGSL